MVEKVARWESELWSYISRGDGVNCPLYSCCPVRRRGGWCVSDNGEYVNRLLDDGQFDFHNYDVDVIPGRIFQLVGKLAQKYLRIEKVRYPPVPTELITVFDKRHTVAVHEVPLTVYHGALWRMKHGWVIQLRKDDASDRKRFTLFHEAFHILAHCRSSPVFRKRGLEQGYFNELVADYFAGGLMAPREWITERWGEVKDLGRMAEIFDIPEAVMWLRLREVGCI